MIVKKIELLNFAFWIWFPVFYIFLFRFERGKREEIKLKNFGETVIFHSVAEGVKRIEFIRR